VTFDVADLLVADDEPFLRDAVADVDGFGIVRRLRKDGNRVPVIFLPAKDAKDGGPR